MGIDPNEIAKKRESQRNAMTTDARQAVATEQVADTLEAIRVILLDISRSVGRPGS